MGSTIRRTIRPGDGDPRHGTTNGYINLRCRCDGCRSAWAQSFAQMQAKRLRRGLADGDPRHGTTNGYRNWGCRCGACTAAASAAALARARRQGVKPRTPVSCGTHSGYVTHYRRGEVPCDPCKAARAEYQRNRNALRKAG